jgi:HK97 family phage prohead protease
MCENCENKQLDHSVKSISAEVETPNKKGEFVFTASTENTDREGDVIKSDGWVLDNFKDGGVLLWGHDQNKLPVGRVLWVKQDEGTLVGKARFNGQTQLSKDVEKLVRIGDLTGISVGFRALDATKSADGTVFNKQELLEVSVVNVPANADAVIHSIKSLEIQSEDLKFACVSKMKGVPTETKSIKDATKNYNQCVEKWTTYYILMEGLEEMDALVKAQFKCKDLKSTEDVTKENVEKAEGDCPMDDKDCPNYKNMNFDEILELKARVTKLEEQVEKKINVDKKYVEIDLRKKRTDKILRRAISRYLENKSKNNGG